MKKLLIICIAIMVVFSISHSVFALSYELDVGQDGAFDSGKGINVKPGETLKVDIWLNGYTCRPDNKLFGTQFYFQISDPAKVQFNSANSFIKDTKHGGTFDPALGGIKVAQVGVYFLVASNFNHVPVPKEKILLATIELKIAAGESSITVANKLGFNGFDDGFVSDCNLQERDPDDAVVTFNPKSKQPPPVTGTKSTPPEGPTKAAPIKVPGTKISPGVK